MDTTESQSTQEPSLTSISQAGSSDYNSTMDPMSTASLRNVNTPASLYLANEMTPETVMTELNMYRPTTTALPLWNGTSAVATPGVNYSIISTPTSAISSPTHPETDTAPHSNGIGQKSGNSGSYDVFPGTGQDEPNSAYSLSPKASFDSGNVSNHDSQSSDNGDDLDDLENSIPKRKKRTPVPDERKDAKYWARRKKNNDAAKRSRDMRRKKLDMELKNAREAITENQKLRQEIDVLKAEINSLRRLLKDANTTLSLWIRARQTAEPNVQLPSMLRGSNVSFVNFPVSTAT